MTDRLRISLFACPQAGRRRLVAALAFAALVVGVRDAPPLATFIGSARAEQADRIVAVGGAVTEILYALGQQNRIVAVDTTSLYPPEALKEKPNVGYMRALSAEGVLSIRPSLVIVMEGAGPPAAIKILSEAGVRLESVPDVPTPAGVAAKIETVGHIAGASSAAERLAARVNARFDELAGLRAKIDNPRRVLFVLSLQSGRPVVGGRGTSADGIIGLAGGINAAGAIEGYKPMADEAIIAAAPDMIVMMRRHGAVAAASEDVFALPTFAATPAAKTRALLAMDGQYLLNFGPRAPDAARDLMAALYPAMNPPPLSAQATGPALQGAAVDR